MKVSPPRWPAAVVLLTLAAGCASQSAEAGDSASNHSGVQVSPVGSSSASPPNASTGTLAGVAREWGGPLLPNGHMALEGTPAFDVPLTAAQNDRPVASTVTGSDGGYRFTLAPGSYVVTGCVGVTVVVVAAQVAHQDITCPVP
jgi:hypothetical protein